METKHKTLTIYKTNAALGYTELAFLIRLDQTKNGHNYLCIGVNCFTDSYKVGGVVEDLSDNYVEESSYEIANSPLYGTYLFDSFIAELYAGQTKQSEPVSLEVENVIISLCNTLENIQSGIESGERPEISDMQKIYDQIYSAVNFIKQSQQPASIAFLSEEEIEKECYKRDLSPSHVQIFESAYDFIQSELRKRVIDPVDLLNWIFDNARKGYEKDIWFMDIDGEPVQHSTQELLQIYINSKTK